MGQRIREALSEGVRDLFPAYFALVMATGIVSIACHLLGWDGLAFPLFYLNIFFYAVLWLLILARIFRYPARLLADLTDHGRSAGFFTLVAGTNVLGVQFALLVSNQTAAYILWIAGLILWLFLIFTFFTMMIVKQEKPGLETGINGGWLLIVVSTQSIAVLGMFIAPRFILFKDQFLFSMICFYLLGCMFYLLIISLVVYRFMFFRFDPEGMLPSYWINMGAVAITTLAGANILLRGEAAILTTLAPFIKGFTLFFWAAGTWWIPLLFLLGAWRHIYKRYPLTYHPLYWGLVFPMGMYTVCTIRLSQALDLPFLMVIPRIFIYFSLLAWALAFIGLLYMLYRKAIPARNKSAAAARSSTAGH